MKMSRSVFHLLVGVWCVAAASPAAFAQGEWPQKPVTIMVGFPAGGASDVVARLYAERLQAKLGQSFIVENKPGATSLIANQYVSKRPADGYTLLFNAQPMVVAPLVTPSTHKYDAVRDFTPIAQLTDVLSVFAVNASAPYKTFAEFIAYARKHSGMVTIGTSGLGSSDHLSVARLEKMAGVDFNIIHYKGENDAAVGLAGGTLDARMAAYVSAKPLMQSGRIRVIAVTGATRSPSLPDVPAIAEVVPGFSHVPFQGIWGPPGMDPKLVQRINREINDVSKLSDVQKQLDELGFQPMPKTSREFVDFLQNQIRTAAEAVKASGIQPQ